MYNDMVCRLCNNAAETLNHVVNCGCQVTIDPSVLFSENLDLSYENKLIFMTIASRINRFTEMLKEKEEL